MTRTIVYILAAMAVAVMFSVEPHCQEIPRSLKITSLGIDGNTAFIREQLLPLIATQQSGLFRTSYYDSTKLAEDADVLAVFYREMGYLDANVAVDRSDENISTGTVRIVFHIEEGTPTTIGTVDFSGNEAFTREELVAATGIAVGDIFRRNVVEEVESDVRRLYGTHGYSEADVTGRAEIDDVTDTAVLTFEINENLRFVIGDIRIVGLGKTHANVVMREIKFKEGDIVNEKSLLDAQRMIYTTGLFRSVYVHAADPESDRPGVKDVLIEVKERDTLYLVLSSGYDTVEEVRGKAELYTINLGGSGRRLGTSGRISFLGWSSAVSFTSPRMFGTKWQSDIRIERINRQEPSYDIRKRSGHLTIGRRLGDHSLVRSMYRIETARALNIELEDFPEATRNDVRSLSLSYTLDRRNNLFNANRGFYTEIGAEWGAYVTNTTVSFLKSTARVKYFLPLDKSTVLATSIDAGYIGTGVSLTNLPLDERFYTGGAQSIRGYDYLKVGPLDRKGKPTGGKIKIVWNVLEIRKTLYKSISGAVFYDVGNVWENPDFFDITSLQSGTGAGVRMSTPIGVLRLDYGVPLDGPFTAARANLYFSLGQAF